MHGLQREEHFLFYIDISVLFVYKIATDQRFVAWKRCLFIVTPWSCNYLCLYWFLCRNLLANYSSFIFLLFLVHLSTISWAEFTVRKDVHHFERVLVKTFYFHLPLWILIVEAYFQLPWFNEKTFIKYDPSSNVLFVLLSNNL